MSGGVSGMAAAAAAAERTCRHLFEKSLHLGGQLRLAGAPPGRDEFVVLAEDLSQRLIDLNVRVILNQTVDAELLAKEKPDSLILATGGEPVDPPIPGAKYHNKVRVLLFLDVGGSMDVHVKACEVLFSAASTEFKHLEFFYFHNFIYEKVWRDNRRRRNETFSFWDVLHTFGPDYKVIVVGDASMSPHEITMKGGSVEHYNDEPGTNWLSRLLQHYQKTVWLNPLPIDEWKYGQSIQMTN